MPTTPPNSSPPRPVLASCTNLLETPRARATSYLPTPPAEKKPKRHSVAEGQPAQKRLKLSPNKALCDSDDSDTDLYSDDDSFMEDAKVAQARARRNTAFQLHSHFMRASVTGCRKQAPSTLPILRSFVSSQKSDTFKCQSIGDDAYLTPPYACSYSHSAKSSNGTPLLAVATEQGTVHILNTRQRNDWDVEPPRTTIQPHNNGIFDVQWNSDDTSLATCSGDQSTRISDFRTGALTHVLRGHTSTVKCTTWDPNNPSLLATGGRDGAICLWDLRTAEKFQDNELLSVSPVMIIHGAHENTANKNRPKPRKGKQITAPRTVTNILYPSSEPYGLVSSSSFDGVLRYWDLRQLNTSKKTKSSRHAASEVYSSPMDPTMLHGSKRSRGIISMVSGIGPSAGLIFAIGADSRVHTYDLPTLGVQSNTYTHENLQTNSFYIGLSVSPCGRWLACGGSGNKGNSFLFDVENACRPGSALRQGVELKGHTAEVGAVDWAEGMLATCADDGVVRVWRPDVQMRAKCLETPEESQWDWLWVS